MRRTGLMATFAVAALCLAGSDSAARGRPDATTTAGFQDRASSSSTATWRCFSRPDIPKTASEECSSA